MSAAYGRKTSSTSSIKPVSYFDKLLLVFRDIQSAVPSRNEIGESFFQRFLNKELQNYVTLVENIISQLEEILSSLKGDISFTSSMQEMAKTLSEGSVPQSWCRNFNVSLTMSKWMCSLRQHMNAIHQYRQGEFSTSFRLDISGFLSTNALFHALMSDWSNTSGIHIHKMIIIPEVCMLLQCINYCS